MKNKLTKSILATIVFIGVLAINFTYLIISSSPVMADGNAGSAGSISGGVCLEEGDIKQEGSWVDKCYGATWRKYTADSDEITVSGTSSGNVPSITIRGCKTYGGSYYLLALERYGLKYYKKIGDTVYHIRGTDIEAKNDPRGPSGGLNVREILGQPGGSGSVPFIMFNRSVTVGDNTYGPSENWDTVMSDFEIAKEHAANDPNATGNIKDANWSDIAWFCWNDDWRQQETESEFGGYSYLSTSAYNSPTRENQNSTFPNPDGTKNVGTITINSEFYQVNVSHQLSYTPSTTEGTYETTPSTSWKTVSTSGGRVYRTYNGTWTPSDSDEINGNGVHFSKNDLGAHSVLVQLAPGKSTTVCSIIQYEPKKIFWLEDESNHGSFKIDTEKKWENSATGSNSGKSTICVIIKRKEEVEEPPEITVEAGAGNFASSTELIVDSDKNGKDVNITHDLKAESDDDAFKEIILSTDEDKLLADFDHWMYFKGDIEGDNKDEQLEQQLTDQKSSYTYIHVSEMPDWLLNGLERPTDEYPEICTDRVTTNQTVAGGRGISNSIGGLPKESEFCYQKDPNATAEEDEEARKMQVYGVDTVTIPLEKASTVRVCQKTEFEPLVVTFEAELVEDFIDPGDPFIRYYHWSYKEKDRSGDGSSEACITVTRPGVPPASGNPKSGTSSTPFLYTGESGDGIQWDVSTVAYNTRRMVQWEATNFLVPVRVSFDPYRTNGSLKKYPDEKPTVDNCGYYASSNKTTHESCEKVATGNATMYNNQAMSEITYQPSQYSILKYNQGRTVIVPDKVGAKYCNSFGYKWEYWYAHVEDGKATWVHDTTNRDYWTHYDAACRTIVKKPSTSVWNGGVFSGNGGVTTSVASRYHNAYPNGAKIGDIASGNPDHSYGSWTEFLAPINGTVQGLSSGAGLSIGSTQINNLLAWSTLTIANNGTSPGNSSISTNSVFRSRLADYIYNNPGANASSLDEVYNNRYIGGTKIINVGDITITNNIELPNTTYSSIYDLPQVIIHSTGNINIASGVTRIDAWLVSDGTVNTCSDYSPANGRPGGTEAYVRDNGTEYNSGANCSAQLVVNGPIIAKSVQLNRTAGADPLTYTSADSALAKVGSESCAISGEIFNLSADTYLWAYAQAGRYTSSYTEAYTRELPPRY